MSREIPKERILSQIMSMVMDSRREGTAMNRLAFAAEPILADITEEVVGVDNLQTAISVERYSDLRPFVDAVLARE